MALIDLDGAAAGFNLVSSDCVDWKRFTLHKITLDVAPDLALPNGKSAFCHGYISGTWAKGDLDQWWTGLQVFVVDAVFALEGSSQRYNFLLGSNALGNPNCHQRRSTSSFSGTKHLV